MIITRGQQLFSFISNKSGKQTINKRLARMFKRRTCFFFFFWFLSLMMLMFSNFWPPLWCLRAHDRKKQLYDFCALILGAFFVLGVISMSFLRFRFVIGTSNLWLSMKRIQLCEFCFGYDRVIV